MHGGQVVAQSDGPGTGSTFTVRLPVHEAPDSRNGNDAPTDARKRGSSRRILVVDDNVDAAQMLGMVLEAHEHEICIVHDGPGALRAAAAFRPQLILLDIGLPGMNGYDVCRGIRAASWGRAVTIIALTGWGQESDRHESRDAGFDHHLVKPVEYAALAALLASSPT